jgi:hypothetical protein
MSAVLNDQELELLQNAEILPARDRIITKLDENLGQVLETLKSGHRGKDIYNEFWSPELWQQGKIHRGERHHGQAWILLDYPAFFDKENILAIRTVALWGFGFRVILQAKGAFVSELLDDQSRHEKLWESLEAEDEVSIGEDFWDYRMIRADLKEPELENGLWYPAENIASASFWRDSALKTVDELRVGRRLGFEKMEKFHAYACDAIHKYAELVSRIL